MTKKIADRFVTLKSLDMDEEILSIARVSGTDEVFVGAYNGLLYHVDLGSDSPKPSPMTGGHFSYVSAIVQWNDWVVSAGSDHRLVWWNRQSRERVRTMENAHAKWIRDAIVHPTSGLLATVGDDMTCRIWDLETGQAVCELKGHQEFTPHHYRNKLFTCSFSRDGKYLATADQTGLVVVWDFESRTKATSFEATKFYEWDYTSDVGNAHSYGGIRALDFSPDGTRIAIGGIFNTDAAITNGQALLQVFEWQTGKQVIENSGGGNFFYENVRFHHGNEWMLATPGAGGAATHANFFETSEPKLIQKTEAFRIYDMALNETSDTLYAVGPKKIAKLGLYAANEPSS